MMTHPRFACVAACALVLGAASHEQSRAEDKSARCCSKSQNCRSQKPSRPGAGTAASRGEYAKIDVALSNDAIFVLKNGNWPQRRAQVAKVLASPQKYAPVVLCVVGEAIFNAGQVDEGSFWFNVGMLRSRFDAKRCTDPTARESIAAFDRQYGVNINRYVAQNPTEYEAMVAQVVAWDRATPHEYDHRWINLHGMRAVQPAEAGKTPGPLSVPEEQWAELAEQTRAEYLGNAQVALQAMKQNLATVQ